MPIQDAFPNLPGMVAQINDNGLKVPQTSQALSQSVLLLGVATDGPVNTPVAITSIAAAEALYGVTAKATSVSGAAIVAKSLTSRIYEAFAAGCTDIRTCRVGGTSSSIALVDSVPANNLTIQANYAGIKYNALTAASTGSGGSLNIVTLDGVSHSFAFQPGVTIYADLMNQLNASNINVNAFQASNTASPLATVNLSAAAAVAFTGGTDGTNPTDAVYSDALTAAYRQLETYPVNVVVPLGAYLQPTNALDNTGSPTIANTNQGDTVYFGQNLAQFCARMTVNTQSCFGVISIAPLLVPTYTAAINRGKQLTGTFSAQGATLTPPTVYTFQYAGDYSPSAGPKSGPVQGSGGALVDTGYLLQIVAGPDAIVNTFTLGNYVIDAAPSYAGLSTSLAPQSATTNKVFANILGLTYNFGATVLNSVVGNRFVALQFSNGAVRCVADQTYSAVGRDFTKLSTLRVVYQAIEKVRNSTSGFIGEAANPANLNAMGTAINSALKLMQTGGALVDYSYQILASSQDQINGNLNIILGLVPALQIRKIYVTVSLSPASAISNTSSSANS